MRHINKREILNALAILDNALQFFDCVSFADCLKTLLEKRGYTRLDLHNYLQNKGFLITKNAMDKYFREGKNKRRPVNQSFVVYFAEFLALTPEQLDNILFILKYERQLRRLEIQLTKPFGGKTAVSLSDFEMISSILRERASAENWSVGVQIPNLEIDKNSYTDDELRFLLNRELKSAINEKDNINEWLIGTCRTISYLLVSTIEEIHLLIAKCIFLWYLLLFLEAAYQVSPESLDRNQLPFKRLLLYFLDFFPCKANRRGSPLKMIFFQKKVFKLTCECPLTDLFNNWYEKVNPVAEKIESEYDIDKMIAFTEEGIRITTELVRSLITNIWDSDKELGEALAKVIHEGFSIDSIRTMQACLRSALNGYTSKFEMPFT